MRKLTIFLLLVFRMFASLPVGLQLDVRTTGNDTNNSGAFNPSGTSCGTDYSQQNSPQISYTDLVVGATTTTYTSVLNAVTSAVTCNTINIVSGTGCTTGIFYISSETAGSPNFATVDRSLGTAASICTAYLGGSFLTVGKALSIYVGGNTIWNKLGTYTITTGLSFQNVNFSTLNGYNSTHGDLNSLNCTVNASICPTLTTSTNSVVFFQIQGGSISIINEIITNTAGTSGYGVQAVNRNSNNFLSQGCVWSGFTTTLQFDNNGSDYEVIGQVAIINSEIKNSSVNALRSNAGYNVISSSWIHGNIGTGLQDTSGGLSWSINNSTISANTGSYGAQLGSAVVTNSNFSANTGTGLYVSNALSLSNVVAYGNGAYGIIVLTGPVLGNSNNFYGANTTAARSGFSAGYNDGILTANPFTSTTNFALNSTSGGGVLLKSAGFPGISPFGTGYIDGGALQSKAASGTSPHGIQ